MGRYIKPRKDMVCKTKKPPKPYRNRYLSRIKKIPKTLNQTTRKDLLKRISESMTRIWGNMPDWIMDMDTTREEMFVKYKAWISEPFVKLYYEEYDDSEEL